MSDFGDEDQTLDHDYETSLHDELDDVLTKLDRLVSSRSMGYAKARLNAPPREAATVKQEALATGYATSTPLNMFGARPKYQPGMIKPEPVVHEETDRRPPVLNFDIDDHPLDTEYVTNRRKKRADDLPRMEARQ